MSSFGGRYPNRALVSAAFLIGILITGLLATRIGAQYQDIFIGVPGLVFDEEGVRLSSRLGLGPDSIYLFTSNAPRTLGRGLGPRFHLIDIAVRKQGNWAAAIGSRPVVETKRGTLSRLSRVVAVIDSSDSTLAVIPGGQVASWSPTGKKLAVIVGLPGEEGPFVPDSIIVWDGDAGSMTRFPAKAHAIGWLGEDTLMVNYMGRTEAVDLLSGLVLSTRFKGVSLSPDRRFSFSIVPELPCTIWDETTAKDVTREVEALLDGGRLLPLPAPFWLQTGTSGSILAVATCKGKTTRRVDPDVRAPFCAVYAIDLSTRTVRQRIPGSLLATAANGRRIISSERGRILSTNVEPSSK